MPKFGLKDGELGEKVNSKAEAMYNPSAITKAAGFAGATLLDTAVTGGFGSASTTIKATLKGVSIVGDYGLRTYLGHKSAKNWSNEEYAKVIVRPYLVMKMPSRKYRKVLLNIRRAVQSLSIISIVH